MKRIILIGFLVVLAILDWAALDDITTGSQPSYFGEYLFLFISFLVYVYVALYFFKRIKGR